MKIDKTWFKTFQINPIKILNTLNVNEIAELIQYMNTKYYNTKPVVPDDIYDITKDELRKKDPKNPILFNIGAQISSGAKVALPVYMGSMDKLKVNKNALDAFKTKYPGDYLITDKLDGVSALIYCQENGETKMYTRGDGKFGQDISHLMPFLSYVPKKIPNTIIRGEMIIRKENWEKIKSAGANPRNVVSGVINAKKPDLMILKFVEFVAYSLIEPRLEPKKQLEYLKKEKYKCAPHKLIKSSLLTFDFLSNVLEERRSSSPFEIDGIVVAHNEYHTIVSGKNPAYAFAFKHLLTKATAEVIVTNIEWNVSKDGLIKPTVVFTPVQLSGVSIKKATGFNGEFISNNIIGPGSHLLITRSGDVIPHIIKVLSASSSGQPQMPEIPYVFSGKDIKTTSFTNEQDLKEIIHFFNVIKIPGLGPGTLKKLYDSNNVKNIYDIININNKNGILRETIVESIKEIVPKTDCITFMVASNTFGSGFGETKIKGIIDSIPDVVSNDTYVPTVTELVQINGISTLTASKFISGLEKYRAFMKVLGIDCRKGKNANKENAKANKENANGKYKNQVIVFTGFRNKEWEKIITDNGGTVSNNVTKSTTLVVAKDPTSTSGKMQIAIKNNIPIISIDDFVV